MKRESTLDIAKGIGIILVVAGHSIAIWGGKYFQLNEFIYSFHMPLFFGISGFFVSEISFVYFVKKKAERLLIPFVFWVVFYFCLHTFFEVVKNLANHFISVNNPISFKNIGDLVEVLFIANYSILYKYKIGLFLWFLPALFSLLVLRRIMLRYEEKINIYVLFMLSTAISFIFVILNNNFHCHRYIPFGFDTAIISLPFVYIFFFRYKIYEYNLIVSPIILLIIWFLKTRNGVGALNFTNYPIFFFTAILGITMILNLSSKINNYKIGVVLAKIGTYSYAIYLLHELIFQLWRPIANRIPFLRNWDILQITSLIFGIFIPILIVPYFRKWPLLNFFAFGEKSSMK